MRAAATVVGLGLLGLLSLLGAPGAYALTRDDFYTNGRGLDQELPPGDEISSREITLKHPITFFGEPYYSIYVNTDGSLSFSTDIASFINGEFPLGYPIIAPFYSNVDTTKSGVVYYRETQDAYSLAKAEEDIRICYPTHNYFIPESVFIATWSNVGYYKNKDDKTNTFQAVIISGGNESYVIFMYPDDGIQWIQAMPQVSGLPDVRAQVGLTSIEGQSHVLKISGKERVRNIASSSNCGETGKYIFRVGNVEDKVEVPELYDDELENQSSLTCATAGAMQCHYKSQCIDQGRGFCCVCNPDYYGDGRSCIRKDMPLRVNGKIRGEINGEDLRKLNFQSYVVTADGRAYSALANVPDHLGYSMQTMSILGSTIGWLFAKPIGNTKNGYQITGGVFNHTVNMLFPDSNQKLTIVMMYMGLDAFDQLRMEGEMKGSIPKIPHGTKLDMEDLVEQYSFSRPGILHSRSSRTFTNRGILAEYRCEITQMITYHHCQYANLENIDSEPFSLNMNKIFLSYEPRDKIVRYGMSSKVVPLGQEDPCIKGREVCGEYSSCIVEDDSYKCICRPGYQSVYISSEETSCLDINECSTGDDNCHNDAKCINLEGSFQCQCNAGYEGDGVDCARNSPCENFQCGGNAQCMENGDAAYCQCNIGYEGDGMDCTKTSPCKNYRCSDNAHCVESGNDPYCQCNAGYENNGENCIRASPCKGYRCSNNAHCVERGNDPYCQCNAGYEHNGEICVKASSCKNYRCGNNAQCVEIENAPYCQCIEGYYGNGHDCKAESVSGSCEVLHNCSPYAQCTPTDDGIYACICDPEYVGDGYNCEFEDIEPSSLEVTESDDIINATCAFTECWCPARYQLSGKMCLKIDEEMTTPPPQTHENELNCNTIDNCHYQAQCKFDDSIGNYKCVCTEGFEGDGIECVQKEVNCEDENICDPKASCEFDPATTKFICICQSGYEGNGLVCEANSCRTSADCEENAECKYTNNNYVQSRSCQCKPGYVKDPNDACIPDGDCNGVRCADHANCLWYKEYKIFYCQCEQGYHGDGVIKCTQNSTECNDLQNCDDNADCTYIDDEDKHKCICRSGYLGNGYQCTKIVTCEDNPYMCSSQAQCIERQDGFVCECILGYIGNGTSCKKILKHEGNFLLLNQGVATLRIPLAPTYDDLPRPINILYEQMAIGLDIDCQDERVYWSDIISRMIKSSNYDGTFVENVFTHDIISPEGLSVDWVSRNIYWTDSRQDTIEVANLNTKIRKVLFNNDLIDPRGIAVHPFKGKVFWSDWNRKNPKIEWANMDGTGRKVFLNSTKVSLPNSLAIDFDTDELCYTDAGKKIIECVHIDTMQSRTVAHKCSYPFGLTITPTHYYWTDWITHTIESLNKDTQTKEAPIETPLGGKDKKLYGMAAVLDGCRPMSNICQSQNGGCPNTQLCLLDGKGGRTCSCGKSISGELLCNDD